MFPVWASGGIITVTSVGEIEVGVKVCPLSNTVGVGIKFAPVIVTTVPAGPLEGNNEMLVAAQTAVPCISKVYGSSSLSLLLISTVSVFNPVVICGLNTIWKGIILPSPGGIVNGILGRPTKLKSTPGVKPINIIPSIIRSSVPNSLLM